MLMVGGRGGVLRVGGGGGGGAALEGDRATTTNPGSFKQGNKYWIFQPGVYPGSDRGSAGGYVI